MKHIASTFLSLFCFSPLLLCLCTSCRNEYKAGYGKRPDGSITIGVGKYDGVGREVLFIPYEDCTAKHRSLVEEWGGSPTEKETGEVFDDIMLEALRQYKASQSK